MKFGLCRLEDIVGSGKNASMRQCSNQRHFIRIKES